MPTWKEIKGGGGDLNCLVWVFCFYGLGATLLVFTFPHRWEHEPLAPWNLEGVALGRRRTRKCRSVPPIAKGKERFFLKRGVHIFLLVSMFPNLSKGREKLSLSLDTILCLCSAATVCLFVFACLCARVCWVVGSCVFVSIACACALMRLLVFICAVLCLVTWLCENSCAKHCACSG